jgi:hypothetical protein
MILFVTGPDYRLPFETFVIEGFTMNHVRAIVRTSNGLRISAVPQLSPPTMTTSMIQARF